MTPDQEILFTKHLIAHQEKHKWMIYGKDKELPTLIGSLAAEYIDLSESVRELQDELSKAADMAVMAYEFVNGQVTLEALTTKLDEHFNPVDDGLDLAVAQYIADMSAPSDSNDDTQDIDISDMDGEVPTEKS